MRRFEVLLLFIAGVCSEDISAESGVIPACVDVEGVSHRLGESYIGDDGCNQCSCTKAGNSCTKRLCVSSVEARVSQEDPDLIEACKDVDGTKHKLGEAYMGPDGCNTCKCMEGGNACTRKLCPSDVDSRAAEAFKCVDNMGVLHNESDSYTHVDGCNTCKCMPGGKGGACTKMFCFEKEEKALTKCMSHDGSDKHVGDTWTHQDGCSKCACGVLGPICLDFYCKWDPHTGSEKRRKMKEKEAAKGKQSPDSVHFTSEPEVVSEEGDQPCKDHEGKDQWPGAVWLSGDGCNVCSCKGDGSEPECSNKGCRVRLERLVQRDPSLQGLEPGVGGEENAASALPFSLFFTSILLIIANRLL